MIEDEKPKSYTARLNLKIKDLMYDLDMAMSGENRTYFHYGPYFGNFKLASRNKEDANFESRLTEKEMRRFGLWNNENWIIEEVAE